MVHLGDIPHLFHTLQLAHNVNSRFVAHDTLLVYNSSYFYVFVVFSLFSPLATCFLLLWMGPHPWLFIYRVFLEIQLSTFLQLGMFKKRWKLNGLWACLLQDPWKGRYKLAGFSAASWGFCVNLSWEVNCFGQLELLVWIQLVKIELESGLVSRPGIGFKLEWGTGMEPKLSFRIGIKNQKWNFLEKKSLELRANRRLTGS